MKTEKIFTIGILALFLASCSSGSESDTTSSPKPGTNTTSGAITYTNTIKSIVSGNCLSCHGATTANGATISLDTYAKVKTAMENNGLIDRISRAQGATGMMPQNGTRLPQATIDKFTTWKNNGYTE